MSQRVSCLAAYDHYEELLSDTMCQMCLDDYETDGGRCLSFGASTYGFMQTRGIVKSIFGYTFQNTCGKNIFLSQYKIK